MKTVGRKARRFQRDMSAPVEEHRFVVGAPDRGARLDAFLASRLSWRSRAGVQELIASGCVRVLEREGGDRDRRRLRPSLRLRRLQEVVLRLDAGGRLSAEESWPSLQVLYEDTELLAVNKPPDASLYPTRRHRTGSLIERVHGWVRARRSLPGLVSATSGWMPSPCHRLDRETSGLVVFAKTPQARALLGRQFEERLAEKVYLAVTEGVPADASGTIDLPLGPDRSSLVDLRVGVRRDEVGRPALTHWIRRGAGHGRGLLELRPKTGRQHQLRAHLAAIGCPIVGDKLYLGGDDLFLRSLEGDLDEDDARRLGARRQALHAFALTFEHPRWSAAMTLRAPLWPDMAALIGGSTVSQLSPEA